MEAASKRSEVRRLPERGRYDVETIHRILDEAMICHVSFSTDGGPVVIPTIHARVGDTLYLHGSHASRMMRGIVDEQVCVAATIVDGIVAALLAERANGGGGVLTVPRILPAPDAELDIGGFGTCP